MGRTIGTLAQRQAKMKADTIRVRNNIPVYYADNDTRKKRVAFIRSKLGITQAEFARMLSISEAHLQSVEVGRKQCQMSLVLLAETIMQADRQAKNRLKVKQRKAIGDTTGIQETMPKVEFKE